MIEELLKYDQAVFLYLNNLGSQTWDQLWLVITNKLSSIPLYVVLLYLIYKNYGSKSTILVLLVVALMITGTDQLSYFFKHYTQRPRPCKVEALQELMRFVGNRCSRFSFFSGHAVNSMATAVFVGLLLKNKYYYLPFLLLFWAFLVGYSRIYIGVHYPLDVFTGMVVGGLFGWGFYLLFKKLEKRIL